MQIGDVIYPLIVVAFFAVAAALVRGCERIIGPDEAVQRVEEAPGQDLAA
jgi:hypothetical protein